MKSGELPYTYRALRLPTCHEALSALGVMVVNGFDASNFSKDICKPRQSLTLVAVKYIFVWSTCTGC